MALHYRAHDLLWRFCCAKKDKLMIRDKTELFSKDTDCPLKNYTNKLENAKQMKSTAIENKLFPLGSLVFRTFDNDDGGSNDNVKHMHHHNNDCNGKSKKKRL